MKLEILEDVDFPKLGRYFKKGEIEVDEEEAQVLLTSPLIIKQQTNAHTKIRSSRNRS